MNLFKHVIFLTISCIPVVSAMNTTTLEDQLFSAISSDNLTEVTQLISQNVNINALQRGRPQSTPLIHAAIHRSASSLDILLESNGIVIDAQDTNGDTSLLHASGSNLSPLLINKMVTKGAQVNHVSHKTGFTPLIAAASKGKDAIVTILIANNALLDAQDNYGMTALMYACKWGHTSTVKLLVKAGANKTLTDSNGATALMYAQQASANSTEIIAALQ